MRSRRKTVEREKRPLLTSLLLVEEKLLEAKYFVARMMRCANPNFFAFELNAFLSASRSVVFLIRKEMMRVPGFKEWWAERESRLNDDPAFAFFRDLRNFSQKEGRVRLVGHGLNASKLGRWRWEHEFVSGSVAVPASLRGRDAIDACRMHLGSLAALGLEVAKAFPIHSCPRNALTPAGVAALGLDLDDVDEAMGLPRGWTRLDRDWPLLRRETDGVDFDVFERLARFAPRRKPSSAGADDLGAALTSRWVDMLRGIEKR